MTKYSETKVSRGGYQGKNMCESAFCPWDRTSERKNLKGKREKFF
jgi:hypothetical protein